jgi:hypothetical protein
MEETRVCTLLEPTLNGGRSSLIKMNTSSIGRTRNALTFLEARMLKLIQSLYGTDTMVTTRDGKLSMLTKHQQFQKKE